MNRITLRFAPVLIALLMAFSIVQFASAAVEPMPAAGPAIAHQDHGDDEAATDGGGSSIASRVIWSLAAIGGLGVVLTALYMLKRRTGGFPENPDWVAPIEVLYTKDSPDEGYYGDADTSAAHGSH